MNPTLIRFELWQRLLEEAEQEKTETKPTKPARNDGKSELSFHTEEMSQEIAELMLNNVGLFAKKASIGWGFFS